VSLFIYLFLVTLTKCVKKAEIIYPLCLLLFENKKKTVLIKRKECVKGIIRMHFLHWEGRINEDI
jgi:hypothetical protein